MRFLKRFEGRKAIWHPFLAVEDKKKEKRRGPEMGTTQGQAPISMRCHMDI